ncbi:MAG: DUF4272 domain-containing protein [Bacteroidetes bacterium]|nr:DUF4272 domain-containing protein [Bacteroidota bacterium]
MVKFFFIISAVVLLSCNNGTGQQKSPTVTIPVKNITPTKEQIERRKKSEDYCKTHAIPVYQNPNSLFVNPEDSTIIRTKDEVVDRALALFYIGLKSEGPEQSILDKIYKDYSISTKLSPEEKSYVTAKQPTEQQKTDANWRYESLHVMLWALGFIDSLSYPDQLCDVAADVKVIYGLTEQQFRQKAKLRSKKELLDQADLILRIDWACVEARVKNQQAPGKLDSGVVTERHHSLNWLIRYMNQTWDKVSIDT